MPGKALSDSTSRVVATLNGCPAWSRLSATDKDDRLAILQCLHQLAKEDSVALREGIEIFVANRRSQNDYSVDAMSKLFLLDRYVFAVPAQSELSEARFFGGWIGVPVDGANVNLLWPFEVGAHGQLALVGDFGGYNGDDFQAIEEFDYFSSRFGRR